MSASVLDRLLEERDSEVARLDALVAAEDFSPESPEYRTGTARIEELNASIKTRQDWDALRSASDKLSATAQRTERRDSEPAPVETRTLGELFVASQEFRSYTGHGTSPRFETRATITTGALPGSAFMTPDKNFTKAVPTFQAPLTALANKVQVSSGSVEWVEFPAAAPLAAVVAEGGPKPEATLTATPVSKTLETIAHHVVVTRQALEDSAQLRSWIDGNLTRGVDDKVEAQLAAALTGATLPTAAGATLLESLRTGIANVQSAGFRPNGIAINPADAAAIDIAIMSGTIAGAVVNGTVWGVPLVPVGAITAGSPIVGDFSAGLTLFGRTGTAVYVSDSHADLFLKNCFVVLAERRALGAVTAAEALVECSVTP